MTALDNWSRLIGFDGGGAVVPLLLAWLRSRRIRRPLRRVLEPQAVALGRGGFGGMLHRLPLFCRLWIHRRGCLPALRFTMPPSFAHGAARRLQLCSSGGIAGCGLAVHRTGDGLSVSVTRERHFLGLLHLRRFLGLCRFLGANRRLRQHLPDLRILPRLKPHRPIFGLFKGKAARRIGVIAWFLLLPFERRCRARLIFKARCAFQELFALTRDSSFRFACVPLRQSVLVLRFTLWLEPQAAVAGLLKGKEARRVTLPCRRLYLPLMPRGARFAIVGGNADRRRVISGALHTDWPRLGNLRRVGRLCALRRVHRGDLLLVLRDLRPQARLFAALLAILRRITLRGTLPSKGNVRRSLADALFLAGRAVLLHKPVAPQLLNFF